MPAKAPATTPQVEDRLAAIGAQVRLERLRLGVSATAAAEAAGLSRVTLHRIERGEPSVAMASYLAVLEALGLGLEVVGPSPPPSRSPSPPRQAAARVPPRIRPADYPELQRLAWQLDPEATLSPAEALALYERNWRHVDVAAMPPAEQALLRALVQTEGKGRLLV